MMVDKQVVTQRLRALKTYLAELDQLAQYSLKELTDDFVKYRAAQHSLQLAAQAIVDIATHIITITDMLLKPWERLVSFRLNLPEK